VEASMEMNRVLTHIVGPEFSRVKMTFLRGNRKH
jgi:hypothetical protein